jgi:AraC-like DNA-binding protein
VNYPLAPYHQAFAKGKDLEIYGDCACTRIFIPTDVLNVPFPLANHLSFNMSVKQCDELMEALPAMDRSLSTGIQRRLLLPQGERPLTQEDVATELFMSVRTLHRLLQREQISFREIVNETLTLRAKLLMDQNELNITQIAQELGYSDAANFTRAFRNQTGITPSEYRKSQEG